MKNFFKLTKGKIVLIILLLLIILPLVFFVPLYFSKGGQGVNEENFSSLLKWRLFEGGEIKIELLPLYEKKNLSIDPISLCEKISWEEKKNTCFALLKNDKQFCDKIENTEYKDRCYFSLSKINDIYSPEICERMETRHEKENCYWETASLLQDSSLCKKTGDLINNCVFNVAVTSNNFSICEEIEMRYDFDREYKNQCFIKVAKKSKDVSVCEKVEIKNWKKSCRQKVENSILKEKAKNENPFLCEKVKGDNLWSGDPFSKLIEKYIKKDNCYYEVAVSTKNVSLCKKIKNQCFQAECIGVLENPFACEKCRDEACCSVSSLRQACYNKAAISMKDEELCGYAGIDGSKNDCYFNLALKIGNINIDFIQ